MEDTILTVFKTMFWGTIAFVIIGTVTAIAHDYFVRKDRQEQLKRHQNRKAQEKN